jgi:hypothetical protein
MSTVAHDSPGPSPLAPGPPNAREVRAAQAAADGASPLSDADAHTELLKILVAAHGTDGVRRMLDALE